MAKKLTAEVFSDKRCPAWAQCAVVDSDGTAYWCRTSSIATDDTPTWYLTQSGELATAGMARADIWRKIGAGFDASDWRHSLILRQSQWVEPAGPHDCISSQVEHQLSTTEPDVVNHPDHYCVNGLECFDVMLKNFGVEDVKTFCRLNAFKYLWRSKRKNGDQDIAKAAWYTKKYTELCEKEAK